LASELSDTFSLKDPKTHELFKDAKEMKEAGLQRLFTCYDIGISWLNAILRQDVYKTEERNLIGRGTPNIVRYDFPTMPSNRRRPRTDDDDNNMPEAPPIKRRRPTSPGGDNNMPETPIKRRRPTSPDEKEILQPLLDN